MTESRVWYTHINTGSVDTADGWRADVRGEPGSHCSVYMGVNESWTQHTNTSLFVN